MRLRYTDPQVPGRAATKALTHRLPGVARGWGSLRPPFLTEVGLRPTTSGDYLVALWTRQRTELPKGVDYLFCKVSPTQTRRVGLIPTLSPTKPVGTATVPLLRSLWRVGGLTAIGDG